MQQMLSQLKKEIRKKASPKRAKSNARFFKTGGGQYGHGDKFLGLTVPDSRKIAQRFSDLPLRDVQMLLRSPWHDERFIALEILVFKFRDSSTLERKKVYDLYLRSTRYVSNWDLVDTSAYKIVGEYLLNNPKAILFKLAISKSMWERRIAVVATYAFIRHNKLQETLRIAHMLLNDSEDLIHKAVGWMLREVGKKSQLTLEAFLKKYYKHMPRTMLRYAIEKFPEKKRQKYLKGTI